MCVFHLHQLKYLTSYNILVHNKPQIMVSYQFLHEITKIESGKKT